LLENVVGRQNDLVHGQKPQFQVCSISMEPLRGNMIDRRIIPGFLNMILHIGAFIIEPTNILLIPIQIGHKHTIGIAPLIKKGGLSPVGIILPSDYYHPPGSGPTRPPKGKAAKLYFPSFSLPLAVYAFGDGMNLPPKIPSHGHLNHISYSMGLVPAHDSVAFIATVHSAQNLAQPLPFPLETLGDYLPALLQKPHKVSTSHCIARPQPRPHTQSALPLSAQLGMVGGTVRLVGIIAKDKTFLTPIARFNHRVVLQYQVALNTCL